MPDLPLKLKRSSLELSAKKENSAWVFMSILGALMSMTSLSTDIYLPAMPQMQSDLQGDVELTITGFLIGFALGQIIWGAISDRYGRKLPLTIGMVLFILGSVGCAMSQTITEIMGSMVLSSPSFSTSP